MLQGKNSSLNLIWRPGYLQASDATSVPVAIRRKPAHWGNPAIAVRKSISVLHDLIPKAQKEQSMLMVGAAKEPYLDQQNRSLRVMLKVVKVTLQSEGRSMDTFTVLDDGSERTIILPTAACHLNLEGTAETLNLRMVQWLKDDSYWLLIELNFWITKLCK